jgi:hypothetical protein
MTGDTRAWLISQGMAVSRIDELLEAVDEIHSALCKLDKKNRR